jgi:hypothetical protein
MNSAASVHLLTTAEQHRRLVTLQAEFAAACNALAPIVQSHRCWNRVALHHLAYRPLRQQFPALGSQMACNAIYSVCKAAREVYQRRGSPYHVALNGLGPLPLLHFPDDAPVWFDRHTLSIKGDVASLFTLDGRMKFQLTLQAELERRFHQERLREIVLTRNADVFALSFHFADDAGDDDAATQAHHRYTVVAGSEPSPAQAARRAPDSL